MKPKITVVTINFNNANGLVKTIESIVNQNYSNLEYIVVDGKSSDGSTNIINDYSKYFTKAIIEPDEGPYFAMNKALQHATGDYIIFINSGDLLCDGILNKIFTHMLVDADIIYGNYFVAQDGKTLYLDKVSPTPGIAFFYKGNLNHQSVFIKTSLHKEYPYDESFRIAADFKLFFTLLIMRGCSYVFVNEAISTYDLSGISSNKANEMLHYKERKQVLSSYLSVAAMDELEVITANISSPMYKYINQIKHSKRIEKVASLFLSFFVRLAKNCCRTVV